MTASTESVAPRVDDPPADHDDEAGIAVAPPRRKRSARLPNTPSAWLQLAVLAVPVAITAFQGWARRWSTEDAFITFRVVDQLLHGNGPNFNGGERIEAATSPLWMYMLAIVKGIFGFVPLPWLAVVGGLVLTLGGVVLAMGASARLERARGRHGFLVPVGVMVFCCIQPVWDFTTSGLETGLVFAWLAGAFYALTSRLAPPGTDRPSALKPLWAPIVIGLGPLVRPDLAVATVIFLAVYLYCSRHRWLTLVQAAAVSLALPVLYQIFRMGYYGVTVPNTAIAKEAGLSYWERGWKYLFDLTGPYLLVVPAVLIVLFVVLRVTPIARLLNGDLPDRAADAGSDVEHRRARNDRFAITAAPVIAGLVLTLFVVKVGGDFMHGRLLLPSLFCILLPVGTVALDSGRTRIVQLALVAILGVWCVAGLLTLGPEYDGRHLDRGVPAPIGATTGISQPLFDTDTGTGDERAFWEVFAGKKNPVSLEDYQFSAAYKDGEVHRERYESGLSYLWTTRFDRQRFLIVDPKVGVVTSLGNIGVFGYVAGDEVWIEDWAGLSDPIGARIELPVRGRPGHEKLLPEYYTVARWTAPNANEAPDLKNARQVLACGDVADLMAATNDPMTPGRFFTNLFQAPKLSSMRIPISPSAAVEQYCTG